MENTHRKNRNHMEQATHLLGVAALVLTVIAVLCLVALATAQNPGLALAGAWALMLLGWFVYFNKRAQG